MKLTKKETEDLMLLVGEPNKRPARQMKHEDRLIIAANYITCLIKREGSFCAQTKP